MLQAVVSTVVTVTGSCSKSWTGGPYAKEGERARRGRLLSRNNKLLGTSASLLVTSALLVVTMFAINLILIAFCYYQ